MAEAAQVVLRFTIPGEPCSKARPRWSPKTRTTYTPEKTRTREAAIQVLALAARMAPPDGLALFSVTSTFYLWSNQVRDIDNLAKLVLDGLKGVVWADDVQVVKLVAAKEPADQETSARTEVVVERLEGQLPRTFAHCATCQRAFRTYPSWKYRQFCSRRCWAIGTRTRFAGRCVECGVEFEAKAHLRGRKKFCSVRCKSMNGTEPATCAVCGGSYRRQKNLARKGRSMTCSRACGVKHGWATRGRIAQIRRRVPTGMGRSLMAAL